MLLERLHPRSTLEQFIAQQVDQLRQADRSGDGLAADDVARLNARQAAEARANGIGQVLRHDLDGDLRVSRAELEQASAYDDLSRAREVDRLLEQYDGDGDNIITLSEAGAPASGWNREERLDALLKLDPDGDGRLTAAELRDLAQKAFDGVDSDRDGRISESEYQIIAPRVRELQMIRARPACTLPPVPAGAQIAAVGAYESDVMSTVAIGSQDQDTQLIDVVIEPGTRPLYIVLTSYESMIWRFSGATRRVAQLVVSSAQSGRVRPAMPSIARATSSAPRIAYPHGISERGTISASGVIGVGANKVAIVNSRCPPSFYKVDDGEGKVAAAVVQTALGRGPDVMVGRYSFRQVSLPSGNIVDAKAEETAVPAGFDPSMWQEAVRFFPGGIVSVDPRKIIARTSVQPHKVLPNQFGLAQLIAAGAIVRENHSKFRIVKPIDRLPPAMYGAHSATLIFPKDMPLPPGEKGHNCIMVGDSKVGGGSCP